jgi:hypothetical protein
LPLQLRVGKTLALNFITKTYEEELATRGKIAWDKTIFVESMEKSICILCLDRK